MTMKRKYILIAGSLFALLVIELTIYGGVYWVKINQLTGKYDHQILMERLNLEKKRISLLDEFERSKFAATGKDAFKRIYNTKRHSVCRPLLLTSWGGCSEFPLRVPFGALLSRC